MAGNTMDVLLATYEGECYLAEQIASIQAQTYKDWRLLVSDDCSSDRSVEIVKRLAQDDSRIRLVGDGIKKSGAKENFAFLMMQSSASYVALSDQDDVWLPEKLTRLMDVMHKMESNAGAEEPLLVFSDAKVVDESLKVISNSFAEFSRLDPNRRSFAHLLAQNVAPGFLMLVNRALIDLAAPTMLASGVSMHDWWLMLCAAAFGRIGYIDEPLALYRQHGDNAIGAQAFSAVERASHMSRMDERFDETLRQATAFRDAYADKLGKRELAIVSEYAAMVEGCCVENVVHLSRSGCWKAGTRKAGQLLSAMRRGGVLAVIVTYNPDVERLAENIAAIAPQVGGLLIYDNGSKNVADVEALAAKYTAAVCDTGKNSGMAIALNEGCAAAWALGADYTLLLDQDSVATPGMVSELMRRCEPDRAIVAPVLIDRNRQDVFEAEDRCSEVSYPMTSGTLLFLTAWRAVGGYDERLFVDWVDDEFYCNLHLHGWGVYRSYGTYLLHELGNQERVFSGPGTSASDTKTMRHEYARQNYPLWRWRDRARGQAITRAKYAGTPMEREQMHMFLRSTVGRVLILEKGKVSKLRAIAEGWSEGRKIARASH